MQSLPANAILARECIRGGDEFIRGRWWRIHCPRIDSQGDDGEFIAREFIRGGDKFIREGGEFIRGGWWRIHCP
jgi:hypothetical protein